MSEQNEQQQHAQQYREPSALRSLLTFNSLGILLLIGALGVSLLRVMTIEKTYFDSSKKTIRIAHWQLELGFREALQGVINAYEKEHPDVRVIQMPVTEKVYAQWLNTHMISGTAPDLLEMGFAKLASDDQYRARFLLPITELIDSPNPYNKGTPLESLPWRETFIDGMRGGYSASLQDYYAAPTSFFSVRMFYNKQMLREATGSDTPPRTFGELMAVCAKVRELGTRTGRSLVPISSGSSNAGMLLDRYNVPFTSSYEAALDEDLSGNITQMETYAGLTAGLVSMNDPAVKAMFECQKRLATEFPNGFMAVGRDQAAFMFVQGNAAFITTGSWDGMSLFQQSKFDVGVINIPIPGQGEEWSQYVTGRGNEATTAGGAAFALYKFSRNIDTAIDFLRFLTSLKQNENFNAAAEWLPIILGGKPSERMKAFMPDPRGFSSAVDFRFGNYVQTVYVGQYWRYLQNEIGYDEFSSKVTEALKNPVYGGDRAWSKEADDRRRWCRNQERVLAVQAMRQIIEPTATDADRKFRTALSQQVAANNGRDWAAFFERVREKPIGKE